ncbi:MAG: ChaN family lipoprotein, partial [Pseudomonadota bacterium]
SSQRMMRYAPLGLLVAATTAVAEPILEADVVFLGEIHDNPYSHLAQAAALSDIAPTAVVFEMLTPEQAAAASDVPLTKIAAATDWANNGWPDFAIYEPIFAALGEAEMYGAGSVRAEIMKIFQIGAAQAFGADAAIYGLTDALPPDQQAARERLQFTAHCDAMPREMMAGLVEVQRYRDARLAATAHDALTAHGPPVVVITGAGHARTDWGAPALLIAAHPEVSIQSKAFIEEDDGTPYDAIELVPKIDRDDPCLAFQGNAPD